MSNNQDNLDKKLSDAKATAERLLNKRKSAATVEVAKRHSPKDTVLWILVAASLIASTFVNSKLPGYWAAANDVWVRLFIIVGLVLVALVCFALTNQGKDFKTLLSDSATELRRVTWPTKKETISWTWYTLVVISIIGFFIWFVDNIFNNIIDMILG